jgi:2-octaprenyl-6-methoxyphenol hydroxylase
MLFAFSGDTYWIGRLLFMSASNISTDVLIVGGGLTGMATAIALARAGIHSVIVDALESAPSDRWGMMLWPPGVRVLRDLGVLNEIEKVGRRLEAMKWFVERSQQWFSVDFSTLTERYFIGVAPSVVNEILATTAKKLGVSILRPSEIASVQPAKLRMRALVNSPMKESKEISCRLVVIADGGNSKLRSHIGIQANIRRFTAQQIVTGIGGGVPFTEARMAMGQRWFGGCVPLGPDRTWFYAAVPSQQDPVGRIPIEHYAELDPEARDSIRELPNTHAITAMSVRIPQWAKSGFLVLGDAAHCMVPHLGLGGCANLEDIPLAAIVITNALRSNVTDYRELEVLQKSRERRIRYLRRVSELFSLSITSRLPGAIRLRDWSLQRLAQNPRVVENFIEELCLRDVPSFSTHVAMLRLSPSCKISL